MTDHDPSDLLCSKAEGSSSTDRVLSLLELMVRENRPLSITEISTQLRLARGTVYSMVRTLVDRNYLFQVKDKRYFLSYQNFVLGQTFRLQFLDVLLCSEPLLVEFVASGAGARWLKLADIFVPQSNGKIFSALEKYSNNTSKLTTAPAALSRRILPWWSNAAGVVLAAFSSPPEQEALMDVLAQAQEGPGSWLPRRADLERQFPTVREERFATNFSDPFHLNEVSLAAPIFNAAGDACAAVSFICRRADYQARTDEIFSALSGLAQEASLALGSRSYYY